MSRETNIRITSFLGGFMVAAAICDFSDQGHPSFGVVLMCIGLIVMIADLAIPNPAE